MQSLASLMSMKPYDDKCPDDDDDDDIGNLDDFASGINDIIVEHNDIVCANYQVADEPDCATFSPTCSPLSASISQGYFILY